jgi:hypothetical protein
MSSTVIKLKNSSVSGRSPSVGDLAYGELALNFNDGRIFFKNSSDTIEYFEKASTGAAANFDVLLTDFDAGLVTDGTIDDTLNFGLITESVDDTYDLGLIVISGVISPNLFILPTYSKSSLPSVSPQGQMIFVTDEVGGSIPAFSDGTNWRRVTDRQVVS